VEGIILDQDGDDGGAGLTGAFTSSAGGNTPVSAAGLFDFTGISGFSNITSFTFSMPLGQGRCEVPGTDCSTMMFDDVTFREHTQNTQGLPEPSTLLLFGIGLAGMGLTRRKQRG